MPDMDGVTGGFNFQPDDRTHCRTGDGRAGTIAVFSIAFGLTVALEYRDVFRIHSFP